MAVVKNEGDTYPTESLVSKYARKHYRIPVRSQHWQLRSLVSAEKQNIVYFPGGNGSNRVQRLNTTTRECETIKLLSFAPRCLVAQQGWLCCGSENGDFVAMRVHENDNFDLGQTIHPDGLDPRDDNIFALISRARRANKSLIAKSMKLAKDRVNCITLWFPPTTMLACATAYEEPVAVLANNDRTVTLVSLSDFEDNDKTEALEVITYPDFVNRAIISPDGRFLIAILDDPYLYVHQRVKRRRDAIAPLSSSSAGEYGWEQTQRILLKSQRKDDRSDSRGSFAACFSSSGAYLAVGTQHGTISIFNAALLSRPNADPLITTFQSSRPQSSPGAIRDMAFCPGPFDILAWTEDRGHVGLTDVRSNFVVRQIVNLDDSSFEHINILDRQTIDPRLLENRRERRDNGAPSSSLAGSSEVRRRDTDDGGSLNTPYTPDDTAVLQALQQERRRRERINQIAQGDRLGSRSRAYWRNRDTHLDDLREATQALPTSEIATRMSLDTDNTIPRLRPEPEDEAALGMDANTALPPAAPAAGDGPGAVFRSQTERARDRLRSSRQLLRDAAASGESQDSTARRPDRWVESLGETIAMMREQRQRQDSTYLTILEILQAGDRSEREDPSSILVPLWDESALRGTLTQDHGVFEVPPSPDNTAGLSWSEDGQTLFVGAQNGIYELHIDTQSRKYSPSIAMR